MVRLGKLILLVALTVVWLSVLAGLNVLAVEGILAGLEVLAQLDVLRASEIIGPVSLVWEDSQVRLVILQGVFVAAVVEGLLVVSLCRIEFSC